MRFLTTASLYNLSPVPDAASHDTHLRDDDDGALLALDVLAKRRVLHD